MDYYDDLERRIEGNLYELFAKDYHSARDGEVFTSMANSLRQIIGKKWFESYRNVISDKRVYILSFEYSLGDQLLKALIKLGYLDVAKKLMADKGKSFEAIKENDIEFALGFGDLCEVSTSILDLLTSKKKDFYAYGLRYRRGMLKQEIVHGEQVEKPDDWKANKNPWEHEKGFSHFVNFKDFSVKAIPYDIPILSNEGDFVNTLRLWKSFSINDLDFKKFSEGKIIESYDEINRANSIVEFLYPSQDSEEGRKLRLMQEYFFASSCIQDIFKKYTKYHKKDIGFLADHIKIQIHDVHPILSILVFIDLCMKKYLLTFDESLQLAKESFVFLHLSLLPESFEHWDIKLIREICPDILEVALQLDKHIKYEFLQKDKNFPMELLIIKDGYLDLLNLAYYISKIIITVNDNHVNLIKNIFLKAQYENYSHKIHYIDLPFDARQYVKEVFNGEKFDKDRPENFDFKGYKEKSKKAFLDRLNIDKNLVNTKSAFVAHLGVFHEYKRQVLSILGVAMQYYRLKKKPNLKLAERTYIFAGKSYPNYYVAKENIKFINALADLINKDNFIKDKIKIIFIEDYNLSKSNYVLPAIDIYQKLEKLSMQASDFGFTKAMLTGSKIVTTNSYFENHDFLKLGLKAYRFGDDIDTVMFEKNYNLYQYLDANKEVEQMFDYYRNLPREVFDYDIDKIHNSIYYFNDEYHIIKNLFEYIESLEEAINDYSQDQVWYNDCLDNIKLILDYNSNKNIENYIDIMEKK